MTPFLAAMLAAGFVAPASAKYAAAPVPPSALRPAAPLILDPGHGGDDWGAVVHGVQEKDIALAVARKLRDRLKNGMPVVLTREDDNYVTLDRRVVDAVDWNGAAFVSIHLNQVRNKKTSGIVVYSFGPDRKRRRWRHRHPSVPPMPAPPRVESRESDALAGSVTEVLREDGFRVEQTKSDYYVLKNPSQPSILIEIGYLSNPDEAARLQTPAYQDKLVRSIAKALERYSAGRAVRAESATAAVAAAPLRL